MTEQSKIENPKSKILGFCAILVLLMGYVGMAGAQQPAKVPRIGFLYGGTAASTANSDAFRQGLSDLGYVEGKTIVIEWRPHGGNRDRQRTLAAELARLKLDIIVTVGSGDTRSAKEATATIPIVMIQAGDPVGSGFVASLARPGGNITGLANLRPELSGKRLELLKETIFKLSRVAVFASSTSPDYAQTIKEIELAAGALGVKVQYTDVLADKDIEPAFRAAVTGRAEAVLWLVSGTIGSTQRKKIAAVAVKSRLPTMYERGTNVEAGGPGIPRGFPSGSARPRLRRGEKHSR